MDIVQIQIKAAPMILHSLAMAFLIAAGWHCLYFMIDSGFGSSNWPELRDLWIGIAWNLSDLRLSIICTIINTLTLAYLIIWGSGGWDTISNKKVNNTGSLSLSKLVMRMSKSSQLHQRNFS